MELGKKKEKEKKTPCPLQVGHYWWMDGETEGKKKDDAGKVEEVERVDPR